MGNSPVAVVSENSFCGLIEFHLEYDPERIVASGSVVREAVVGVLENFERYECGVEIFGDLRARYQAILSKLDA